MRTLFFILSAICIAAIAGAQPLQGPFEIRINNGTSLDVILIGARSDSVTDLILQSGDSIYHAAVMTASGTIRAGWSPFPLLSNGWTPSLKCMTTVDTFWAAVVYEDTLVKNRTMYYRGTDEVDLYYHLDYGDNFPGGPGEFGINSYAFTCGALPNEIGVVANQTEWVIAGPPFTQIFYSVTLSLAIGNGGYNIYRFGDYGSAMAYGASTGIAYNGGDTLQFLSSNSWRLNVVNFININDPWTLEISTVTELPCGGTILATLKTHGGKILVLETNRLLEITGAQPCQLLSVSVSNPLAACSHPDYGIAWLERYEHGLVLNRIDTSGNAVYPAGAIRWPDTDHEIVEAALDITNDGLLTVLWSERGTADTAATSLYLASVGWSTYLDASERSFIPHPSSFSFSSFPNPFNGTLKIEYSLPTAQNIKLSVYNVLGQKVETLVAKRMESGSHTATWNPNCAGGVYFITLKTETESKTTKVLYLR
jgi:hypothetical protein